MILSPDKFLSRLVIRERMNGRKENSTLRWKVSGPKETWDKSHSVPVASPRTSLPTPTLNLSRPEAGFLFPQFHSYINLPFWPCTPLVFSCSLDPLALSPLLSHLPTMLHVSSHGLVQSGPFQKPLSELSLISTVKTLLFNHTSERPRPHFRSESLSKNL